MIVLSGSGTQIFDHICTTEKEVRRRYLPHGEVPFFFIELMSITQCQKGFYPLVWDFIQTYKKVNPQADEVHVLSAHANVSNGVWYFDNDLDSINLVQSWIDEHDGKAALLILEICNRRNLGRITSRSSMVIHPRSTIKPDNIYTRRPKLWIYVPGLGYLSSGDERLEKLECISHLNGVFTAVRPSEDRS